MNGSRARHQGLWQHVVLFAVVGLALSANALQSSGTGKSAPSPQKKSANQPAAAAGSSATEEAGPFAPRSEWIPVWAQPGNFHFARLDGGPIETQKTARSAWGKTFTSQDKEVLGNLYGKYAGPVTDLLSQAGVNWVWITWSVGFSWQHEAEQRKLAQEMVKRLHRRGIHVTAYMCASTIFWQNMFLDQPKSVGWVKFDPNGIPYMYEDGADPLRFLADVGNPGWVALEEKRIGAAIDAGFDAVFLDNTSDPELADAETMNRFFHEIRRYIHQDKHSHILLLSNFGLDPKRAVLDKNTDVVFDEFFQEPGAWGSDWNVSNIRRMKYLRGLIPSWKPLIAEYSNFRHGNRSTMFLSPRSERLSIAEAATFGGSYAWNSEGPFDDALIHQTKAAMASWRAISLYNHFLIEHKDLYHGATQVANYLVLMPGTNIGFSWRTEKSHLYDKLAERSVLFDLKLVEKVNEEELAKYRTVIIPKGEPWPQALKLYQQTGGKVDAVAQASKATMDALLQQPPACASLRITLGHDILGNITRIDGGKALAIHILNYSQAPVTDVRIGVDLGAECRDTITGRLELLSPDYGGTDKKETVQMSNQPLSFILPKLDTYVVAVLR